MEKEITIEAKSEKGFIKEAGYYHIIMGSGPGQAKNVEIDCKQLPTGELACVVKNNNDSPVIIRISKNLKP